MAYLRLMKYPGAKTVLIPDIIEVFRRSGLRKFVDVFGGSGIVSLNVDAELTVYNDVDGDLVNLFRVIQKSPDALYNWMVKSTMTGRLLYETRGTRKSLVSPAGTPGNGKNEKPDMSNEERAFSTLYRFTTSFGGMGETYDTNEKSTYRYALRTIQQFNTIRKKVYTWSIENLDFRQLITKYDSPSAFFYIDPPFVDKKWYNHNFSSRDYENLRDLLSSMKGKYLMNLNTEDEELEDIFGEPDFIKRYENQNQNAETGKRPPRLKSFYTNS